MAGGNEPNAEKKCPYCAEVIKAEAIKCRFCGSDLTGSGIPAKPAAAPPPMPAVAGCSKCNVAMVPTQVRKAVSAGGCIGALLFLCGLLATPFGIVPGLVVMALGIIVGSVGGKKTVMVCPSCGAHGTTIAT